MSKKRKSGPRATAASMVLETLKKRNAFSPETAISVSAFKDLPLATNTLAYTIANLVEEGVVGQTDNEKYYFDELGYKALEVKFIKGYSMFIVVPIVLLIIVILIQHYFHI